MSFPERRLSGCPRGNPFVQKILLIVQVKTLLAVLICCVPTLISTKKVTDEEVNYNPYAEVVMPYGCIPPSALPEVEEQAGITGDSIVETAFRYLGTRYRMGYQGPSAFDCSGFTSFVFAKGDITLTRTSRSQFNEGIAVDSICNLRKGDLVFFGGRSATKSVGHVGIVTEVDSANNHFYFIHASCKKGVTVTNSSEPYYSLRYLGARRVL